jgi:hypothetical protein
VRKKETQGGGIKEGRGGEEASKKNESWKEGFSPANIQPGSPACLSYSRMN